MVAVHGYEQTAIRTSSVAFFRLTQLVSFKKIHFWWSHNEYKILTHLNCWDSWVFVNKSDLVRERLICTTKKLGICRSYSSYVRDAKNLLSILCCHNRRVMNEEEKQRKKQIRSSPWACSVKMSTFFGKPTSEFFPPKNLVHRSSPNKLLQLFLPKANLINCPCNYTRGGVVRTSVFFHHVWVKMTHSKNRLKLL